MICALVKKRGSTISPTEIFEKMFEFFKSNIVSSIISLIAVVISVLTLLLQYELQYEVTHSTILIINDPKIKDSIAEKLPGPTTDYLDLFMDISFINTGNRPVLLSQVNISAIDRFDANCIDSPSVMSRQLIDIQEGRYFASKSIPPADIQTIYVRINGIPRRYFTEKKVLCMELFSFDSKGILHVASVDVGELNTGALPVVEMPLSHQIIAD